MYSLVPANDEASLESTAASILTANSFSSESLLKNRSPKISNILTCCRARNLYSALSCSAADMLSALSI